MLSAHFRPMNARPTLLQEARCTLALALPMTAGQVGQMLLGFSDSIMVGRLGVVPLAACAFANGILNVLYVTCIGLLAGVSILVAQAHGAGRGREAGETLRHGLAIALVTGTGLGLAVTFGYPLLRHLGEPPAVVAQARPFLVIVGWSLLPALGWQCLKQYCDSLSHPVLPMTAMLAAVVLNIFLSWVLIYGHLGAPALGLAGAAWATFVTRGLLTAATAVLILRARRFRDRRPPRWWAALSWLALRAQLALGLPVALQLLLEVGLFSAAAVMMGWLGAGALAAHQVAISYAALTFMVPLGLGIAVSVRVSQAVGAGEWTRVRRIGLSGIGMAAAVMCLTASAFLAFGATLAGFFIRDAATAALAAQLLAVAGVFQIFDGAQIVSMSALRGLSDGRVPTGVAFVAYWLVALPTCYFVGSASRAGARGVWWGLALGLAVAATLLTVRFLARTAPGRFAARVTIPATAGVEAMAAPVSADAPIG